MNNKHGTEKLYAADFALWNLEENMRIISYSTRSFNGELLTRFKFDKLNEPEEVICLVNQMRSCGINIESLTAMEFGDYDDDKKIITYLNNERLNDLVEDFKGIGVETYNMRGTIRNTKFVATVYPDVKSLSIRYDPACQREVEEIVRSVANKE